MKKYTLTIPDLTREQAVKIAEDVFGSMRWGPSDDGKSLAAYPHEKPVLVTPQYVPRVPNPRSRWELGETKDRCPVHDCLEGDGTCICRKPDNQM